MACSSRCLYNPSESLVAGIDMGTSSFKLLIAEPQQNGSFLPILRHSDQLQLGRTQSHNSNNSEQPFSLSQNSLSLAIDSLRGFRDILDRHGVEPSRTRCVATSAVREASNREELVGLARDLAGLEVSVISGEEEARLAYLSSLEFFPFHGALTLCVDIGGGSTEFAIGLRGNVLFACSLKLGHVTLAQRFGGERIEEMRSHVRAVIGGSEVVGEVGRLGFDVVVGSSGTIRAMEKAKRRKNEKRDWRLRREELGLVVDTLLVDDHHWRNKVFKKRSETVVAGAVLLQEIFDVLGIHSMEVSRFGLLEGVVAEIVNANANAKLRSASMSASRIGGMKRMLQAANCAGFAKEIFEGVRKCDQLGVTLTDEDLEYLEAACLLHNIGLCSGKKGYHKQSYNIIMTGNHLPDYSTEEVKLIALLARYHRKKFPELDHSSFVELPEEVKTKFKFLCPIIRVSFALWKHQKMKFKGGKSPCAYKAFDLKLVLRDLGDPNFPSSTLTESDDNEEHLWRELEYFKTVFDRDLSAVFSSKTSDQLFTP